MKKKLALIMVGAALVSTIFTGCGSNAGTVADTADEEAVVQDETEDEELTQDETEDEALTQDEADETAGDDEAEGEIDELAEAVDINIGSLKGPTSIGLLHLMELAEENEIFDNYNFEMAAAADELLPKLISGDLDIVLVPANVASTLYNKTEGNVSVIDINTLGVLYIVSGDKSVQSIEDLKGKTLYLTGKGTTPDYTLRYILDQNGISVDDLTLEYKSEATEVAALLAQDSEALGLLPQPFVTAACMQNEDLDIVIDMTEEWDNIQGEGGSRLVTGATVVRNEFLQQNEDAVLRFMEEHKESTAYTNENVQEAAELTVKYGIVEKAAVAEKAIPFCNITYIDAEEMQQALAGYLEVLYDEDASSVGGALPEEDFYYIP